MGAEITASRPLTGGSIANVWSLELADGRVLVAKTDASGLALEGWMLGELARVGKLPVPRVFYAVDDLLLLEKLPAGGSLDAATQIHAADLLAGLHGVTGDFYGLDRDTVIGGLAQPNAPTDDWRAFFAEHRLLHMAGAAARAGRLPHTLAGRIEAVAGRLAHWIDAPAAPALIHGDMWDGNILCAAGPEGARVTGFVDPAIYYADPEIELAFATLFHTFGDPFFGRYGEHRPIAPGFFEIRRDLYNLYPLLVHVRLFGAGYLAQLGETLDRLGA
ncbi:MAG: fructosamine kinase family protein [Alphaproteobacteria bacterium]|nr:fructosamine kinase family protein [Alphaproteobacteria bacterium]